MSLPAEAWLDRQHHLGSGSVLVQRHRHGAQPLHRAHRRVQARPVVADERHMRAALQASGPERRCQRHHLVAERAPAQRVPDAAGLLADGRMLSALLDVTK